MKRQVRDCDGCARDNIGPTDKVPQVWVPVPKACAEDEGLAIVDLCPQCLVHALDTILQYRERQENERWVEVLRERGYAARRRVKQEAAHA